MGGSGYRCGGGSLFCAEPGTSGHTLHDGNESKQFNRGVQSPRAATLEIRAGCGSAMRRGYLYTRAARSTTSRMGAHTARR